MKKALLTVTLFVFVLMTGSSVFAQNTKTWNGPAAGLWSAGANWLPAGVPASTDTVIFNSANSCDLDINPVIASLRAQGVGGNILSTGGVRSMTIGNAAASPLVFSVDAGASLSLGNGGFGISFSTYPTSGASYAQVAGTLTVGFASTWIVNNAGLTNLTNTDISGTITAASIHTGALFNNSSTGTVRFLSGSNLNWQRNGGTIPVADYQNGSTINVTGVVGTMAAFSAGANYNGLLIWNNISQTVTGATAVLLPSATASMDSIRVVSTGIGSLRMFSNPTGYTIGHLEVQGGVTEMGAPTTGTGTCTITTDLKIIGGSVYGNSTFAGDAGSAFPMTVTVNGNFTQTAGTVSLTARPIALAPGGACILAVKGNVSQTGGLLTTTTTFGSQNELYLNGTAVQNVQISNFTNSIAFVVGNATNGASLLSSLVLPAGLNLLSGGFIQLNTFDLSVAAGLIFSSGNGKAVTNSTGALKVTGLTALSSQAFPVAPTTTTYNPVTLVPSAGAFSPNTYAVKVETGLNPNIAYPFYAVNRTWTVTATNTPAAGVTTTLQYANTDGAGGFVYGVNVDHGVYYSGGWNIDASNVTPVFSSPNYSVTTSVVSLNGGVGLPMVVGGLGSILSSSRSIDLSVQKQNSRAQLNWILNTTTAVSEAAIQRSSNGRDFETLATAPALINSYTDDRLMPGTNYYRIRATDINGKVLYSAIAAIINSDAGFDIVSLLPNIVRSNMQLNIAAAQKTKLDVVITDAAGRPVSKSIYSLAAGSNAFSINTERLAAGMYQLTATISNGEVKTMRFVKQ